MLTGVSGSGKSSLLNEVLLPALKRIMAKQPEHFDGYDKIEGAQFLDKVINIDQSAIGRTPRSNPATYVGAFTPIRELSHPCQNPRQEDIKPEGFHSM